MHRPKGCCISFCPRTLTSPHKNTCVSNGETCYAFHGLSFGLNTAPRVFSKLIKPIAASLRKRGIRIIVYLDDFLILGSSIKESKANTQLTPSAVARFHHNLGNNASPHSVIGPLYRFAVNVTQSPREKDHEHTEQMSKSHSQSHFISSRNCKPHRVIRSGPPYLLAGPSTLQRITNTAHKIPRGLLRQLQDTHVPK